MRLQRPRDVRVHTNDERQRLEGPRAHGKHARDLREDIPHGLQDGVRGERPGEGEELREREGAWGLLRVLLHEPRELRGRERAVRRLFLVEDEAGVPWRAGVVVCIVSRAGQERETAPDSRST